MLDLHSTQGRGSRTTSLTLPHCLCVAVSGRARACLYEHLSYPLVCIFVSKIKLLCSTRAKQSCVSKATIWGGGGRKGAPLGAALAGERRGGGGGSRAGLVLDRARKHRMPGTAGPIGPRSHMQGGGGAARTRLPSLPPPG